MTLLVRETLIKSFDRFDGLTQASSTTRVNAVKPFVLSLSKHEWLNTGAIGFLRSPFDKLRANGEILSLTTLPQECHPLKGVYG
jgi:hypothetical protein